MPQSSMASFPRKAINPFQVGNPADFFQAAALIKPYSDVIAVARESHHSQKKNLPDQVARVITDCKALQLRIIEVKDFTGSGKLPWIKQELYEMEILAKESGAVMVAETVDRFLRPAAFRSDSPNLWSAPYTLWELQSLGGCKKFTIVPPESSPAINRGNQTIRGMEAKIHKGGRGMKDSDRKSRKARWIGFVCDLAEKGKQPVEILDLLHSRGVSISLKTLCDWLTSP